MSKAGKRKNRARKAQAERRRAAGVASVELRPLEEPDPLTFLVLDSKVKDGNHIEDDEAWLYACGLGPVGEETLMRLKEPGQVVSWRTIGVDSWRELKDKLGTAGFTLAIEGSAEKYTVSYSLDQPIVVTNNSVRLRGDWVDFDPGSAGLGLTEFSGFLAWNFACAFVQYYRGSTYRDPWD